MLSIKELELTFNLIEKETPKNGDTLYFGFINCYSILRTYCYLAQSQIDELAKTYKVVFQTNEDENLKTLWKNKKEAKAEKFFINIGLLELFKNKEDSFGNNIFYSEQRFISRFKKTPFLQFALSDKPEIFHKIENPYSYKELPNVRIGDFDFSEMTDQNKANSIGYKIKDITNLKDLSLFVFGTDSKECRKKSLEVVWHYYSKDDFTLNYQMIRFIWLMREFFKTEEILNILNTKMDQVKKLDLFRNINYMNLQNPDNSFGLFELFKNITDFNQKQRIFLNFNIPSHVLRELSLVMKVAYPVLKPDLNTISDAQYFYNNLSRDYGRLHLPNEPFIPLSKYNAISEAIDGKVMGEYHFKVPKDYFTMIKWGSQLCNCAGNFDQKPHYAKGLPVAIYKGDKLRWLLDISDSRGTLKVNQFKGFKNSVPKSEELNYLMTAFDQKLEITISENIEFLKTDNEDLI